MKKDSHHVGAEDERRAKRDLGESVTIQDLPVPPLEAERTDRVRGGTIPAGAQVAPSQTKVTVMP
jgi:hypothetical protein